MAKYTIQVISGQVYPNDQVSEIETDGFVLLYLDQGKIKVTGRIEFSELAPLLMKVAMEKLTKQ